MDGTVRKISIMNDRTNITDARQHDAEQAAGVIEQAMRNEGLIDKDVRLMGEIIAEALDAAGFDVVLRADPDTSNELFTEARRLLDAATPGPWTHPSPTANWFTTPQPIQIDEADWGQETQENGAMCGYRIGTLADERAWRYADAELIAAAPRLIAALLERADPDISDEHKPCPHCNDKRLLSHGADTYEWVDPSDWRVSEVRLLESVETVGEKEPENLLVHGDALHALTALATLPDLAQRYLGKVKLCYIDPPFNTGQTFTHYDDALDHSVWLTMLRDRLVQIRKLLGADGSVWVHLDDAEQHRARSVLDEVFGAENFVATLLWQKVHGSKNSARHFSTDQDYIHIYAKNIEQLTISRLPRTAGMDARYTNPDGDPRGVWTSGDLAARNFYGEGTYPITAPSGRVLPGPPPGSYWRYSETRFRELDEDGRIWWGEDGGNVPRIKRFLSEVSDGRVPQTWWSHDEVGHTQEAKKSIKALFPGVEPFATPKPERLMERIIRIGSEPGDIVLDCYAGSGTTAAVAHKMGRRWVTSEVSEETIDEFVLPRLRKVVAGDDPGGVTSSTVEQFVGDLPDGLDHEPVRKGAAALKPLFEHGTFEGIDGVDEETVKKLAAAMRKAAKVRKVTTEHWTGGGGFEFVRVGPSMFAEEEFLDHLIPADELRLTRTTHTQKENEHG
jgi:adenine-specific DNA-methyltransferase